MGVGGNIPPIAGIQPCDLFQRQVRPAPTNPGIYWRG
jgi:hypothetical protein